MDATTITKFAKENPITFFVILAVLIVGGYHLYKKYITENMTDLRYYDYKPDSEPNNLLQQDPNVITVQNDDVNIYPGDAGYQASHINFSISGEQVLPLDLLPKSSVASEFDQNSSGLTPTQLSDRNYLVGGYSAGIDTQGSSNKNPTYDIRGDVPIPANLNTTPFNQSSLTQNEFTRQLVMTNN